MRTSLSPPPFLKRKRVGGLPTWIPRAHLRLLGASVWGLLAVSEPAAAAELMVCYAVPNSKSLGPIFLQEALRCAAADKTEAGGKFLDMPRGLAELYEKGWRLVQVLERRGSEGAEYLAYVERR
jgi:hypothetical protein